MHAREPGNEAKGPGTLGVEVAFAIFVGLKKVCPPLRNDLSSQYLDLHGLYVEEALAALQERLQSTTGTCVQENMTL